MAASARSPEMMANRALWIFTRSSLRGSGTSSVIASAVPIFSIVKYEEASAQESASRGPPGRFGSWFNTVKKKLL